MNGVGLVDPFGRRVSYVRLSVTDRCDFRCVYCMAEDMTFVPRPQVLTLEEMLVVAQVFVQLGVRKIRLTGGEPLVRRGILWLVRELGSLPGLDELVMTTNGSRLDRFAGELKAAGIRRLNISLDSLKVERFRELTRTGDLFQVLRGIDAALSAGFERLKINAVILRGRNEDEILDLVDFAMQRGMDISFIEEMPLGLIGEHDRANAFMSSAELRERISQTHALEPAEEQMAAGGPSRYWRIPGCTPRIGFISPHSHNFCHLCNRVRVTAEGKLLLCLGNEHSCDLRDLLRGQTGRDPHDVLREAIVQAMRLKPEKHHFDLAAAPDIVRFMNMTGG